MFSHAQEQPPTHDTKAGREKDKEVRWEEDNRGVNARILVCHSPHPSLFTWASEENRCDLRKRGSSRAGFN